MMYCTKSRLQAILLVFIFKEKEVRPAGVLGIEVLFAAVLKAQPLVDLVRRSIRSQGVKTDRLHALAFSQPDSLTNHLRADAGTLFVGTYGQDMYHGYFVIGHVPGPINRVIILALVHCHRHSANDDVLFPVQV